MKENERSVIEKILELGGDIYIRHNDRMVFVLLPDGDLISAREKLDLETVYQKMVERSPS